MGDKHCQVVCPQQIAELNCAVFISTIEPNLLFNMKIRKKVILLASVGSIKEIYLSVFTFPMMSQPLIHWFGFSVCRLCGIPL